MSSNLPVILFLIIGLFLGASAVLERYIPALGEHGRTDCDQLIRKVF